MVILSQVSKAFGFISLIIFSLAVFGQEQTPNDYEYQTYKEKLPKASFVQLELINEDLFDLDPNGPKISNHYFQRILCLDKNAINLKKRNVGYNNFFSITNISATLYYPENGKYKKEKVKDFEDKAVITDDINFYDDYREKQFYFENIREGSVIDLSIDRTVNDYHLLPNRSFSSPLHSKKELYRAKVHKDIEIGFFEFNMDRIDVSKTEKKEGDYIIYEWTMIDSEKEVFSGQDRYEEHVEPIIVPYIKGYTINDKEYKVLEDISGLFRWYNSLIDSVDFEIDSSTAAIVREITADSEGIDQVRDVYSWVQSNIKYIAMGDGYGGFIPRDPEVIYGRRYGDCKDMSCLTITMLRELGYDAHFTWVGTRTIPYEYSDVPSPAVDNHMIVSFYDEKGKLYFLDATNPLLKFGRSPSAIQNKEVLIAMDKNTYRLDTVPITPAVENSIRENHQLKLSNDTVLGSGVSTFTGYFAEEIQTVYSGENDEESKDNFRHYLLLKGSNKYHIQEFDHFYDEDDKDTVRFNADYRIEDYIQSVDGITYVNLNLTKDIERIRLSKTQDIPYFFDWLFLIENNFDLEIGEGSKVDYLPDNYEVENELLKCKINYEVEGQTIHYSLLFESKLLHLEVDQLESWNKSIKKIESEMKKTIAIAN